MSDLKYTIDDFPLSYSTTIRDLGVTFNAHKMYSKTLRVLGFIKRNCSLVR